MTSKVKEIDTYPRNFQRSENHDYDYLDMGFDTLNVKVNFRIRKERMKLLEEIIDLKYHGSFTRFIEEAIMNQVESDLNSPETIAVDFCKQLLKNWINNNPPATERKSLQNPVDYW